MNLKHLAPPLAALLVAAASPAFADKWKDPSGKGRGDMYQRQVEKRQPHGQSYFHRQGYTRLDIPKGHYPAPSECRVWYPERPPGQQPPPGQCSRAAVPPGAWLIRHPANHPDHLHVEVYESERPGRVLVVGEFELGSGRFVRIVLQ